LKKCPYNDNIFNCKEECTPDCDFYIEADWYIIKIEKVKKETTVA